MNNEKINKLSRINTEISNHTAQVSILNAQIGSINLEKERLFKEIASQSTRGKVLSAGERIFSLRRAERWSRNDVSEKCGVDPARLNRIEEGTSYFPAEDVIRLCELFKISADELLGMK